MTTGTRSVEAFVEGRRLEDAFLGTGATGSDGDPASQGIAAASLPESMVSFERKIPAVSMSLESRKSALRLVTPKKPPRQRSQTRALWVKLLMPLLRSMMSTPHPTSWTAFLTLTLSMNESMCSASLKADVPWKRSLQPVRRVSMASSLSGEGAVADSLRRERDEGASLPSSTPKLRTSSSSSQRSTTAARKSDADSSSSGP